MDYLILKSEYYSITLYSTKGEFFGYVANAANKDVVGEQAVSRVDAECLLDLIAEAIEVAIQKDGTYRSKIQKEYLKSKAARRGTKRKKER